MNVLIACHPKTFSSSGDYIFSYNLYKELLKSESTKNSTLIAGEGVVKDICYPFSKSRYQSAAFNKIFDIINAFDLIHFNLGSFNVVKYLKKIEIPLVVTIHTPADISTDISYRYREDWIEFLSKNNVIVVFPSNYAKNSFCEQLKSKEFNDKLLVIRHGVLDDYKFDYSKVHKCIEFLSVGRLDNVKNQRKLSEILGAKLVIIGNLSTHEDDLSGWLKDFYKNGTKWLPAVSRNNLFKIYSASNINISFSKSETFGYTMIEAALCGTPSIVFNKGGLGESAQILGFPTLDCDFRSKNKLRSKVFDLREFLESYYSDDNHRLELIKKAKENFNVCTQVKSYTYLYENLIERCS